MMDSAQLSMETLKALGLTTWSVKPGFTNALFQEHPVAVEDEPQTKPQQATQTPEVAEMAKVAEDSESLLDETPQAEAEHQAAPVVWIGSGMNAIWQNEMAPEWHLLTNLLTAFNRSTELMVFDTDELVTEESVWAALEEVIDSGAEHVFTTNAAHELVEQLSEGVEVLSVPRLDELLASPALKKQLYRLLLEAEFGR